MKGYIGTYEGVGSIGIYGFEMDVRSGEMSGGELVCEAPDAKFLALEDGVLAADGRFLITANRDSRDLVSFPVDQGSGRIGKECGRVRTGRAVCIALEE